MLYDLQTITRRRNNTGIREKSKVYERLMHIKQPRFREERSKRRIETKIFIAVFQFVRKDMS